jgi:predicted transcriptional regulator
LRKTYRSRVRIYYDILNAVLNQGHARVTAIMRDANLPYDRLQSTSRSWRRRGCSRGIRTTPRSST